MIATAIAAVVIVGSGLSRAEGLHLSVGAVGAVTPEGMVGPELSLRLMPLKSAAVNEAAPYLWVEVAATTEDFSRWGLMTGVSAELQAVDALTLGVAERGGFGWDWTRKMWVLYVSRSLATLFK